MSWPLLKQSLNIAFVVSSFLASGVLADSQIHPFLVSVPDSEIRDLKERLSHSRLPDQLAGSNWSYGTDTAYLSELLDYWQNEFDWRQQEQRLNAFNQFVTEIDGLKIHFIHQQSPHPGATPLMITHGWPGSIVEFHKIIEPLVRPELHGGDIADAFHVIAPSLPGFGFSEQ